MTAVEINRFLTTMEALQSRRDVYKHLQDDTQLIIDLIVGSVSNNQNIVKDIYNYVKNIHPIGPLKLKQILDTYEGELWEYTKGYKTTKIYKLIQK